MGTVTGGLREDALGVHLDAQWGQATGEDGAVTFSTEDCDNVAGLLEGLPTAEDMPLSSIND